MNSITSLNPELSEAKPEDLKECDMCFSKELNTLELGEMMSLENINVHYFCLLFAAGLKQRGNDYEGILGFLLPDIKKEINRAKRLKCRFCNSIKATVGCSVKTCKFSYHFPCGLRNKCTFRFSESFDSLCPVHSKKKLDMTLPKSEWKCPICSEDIAENPLATPCCKKAVFHPLCMKKMAKFSGYYFKCPLCNAKEGFIRYMRENGVFVPECDAAWEVEPDAFEDLYFRDIKCDAEECNSPHGRRYDSKEENDDWLLIICKICGSCAVHRRCSALTAGGGFKCKMCDRLILHEEGQGQEEAPNALNNIEQDQLDVIGAEPGPDCIDTNTVNPSSSFASTSTSSFEEFEKENKVFSSTSVRNSWASELKIKTDHSEENVESLVKVKRTSRSRFQKGSVIDTIEISSSDGSVEFDPEYEEKRREREERELLRNYVMQLSDDELDDPRTENSEGPLPKKPRRSILSRGDKPARTTVVSTSAAFSAVSSAGSSDIVSNLSASGSDPCFSMAFRQMRKCQGDTVTQVPPVIKIVDLDDSNSDDDK